MPHQCVHCGKIYPDASRELLEGCSCGSRFFYYVRKEKIEELKNKTQELELGESDKKAIEKDLREITGLDEDLEQPVVLDLESIRALGPGKFEIDIVNLFSKNRPLIYKISEGKYIIDLAKTLKIDMDEKEKARHLDKQIIDLRREIQEDEDNEESEEEDSEDDDEDEEES
ncbi:MAG: Zn-ribbon domain-containing protein [Candidatus Nanoarchaeia archaeon]